MKCVVDTPLLPSASRPEPVLTVSARKVSPHRRLAAFIASRSATGWTMAEPWPLPAASGAVALLGVGWAWAIAIGFILGGGAGACLFLIGAVWGAPIGAIVGLLLGLPTTLILVGVLLVRDRPPTDLEALTGRVAGVLAALLECLLAALAIVPIAWGLANLGSWGLSPFLGTLAICGIAGPIILLGASALLQLAVRDLVRVWARAWGWRVEHEISQ